ncbi:MAG: hypothetical protein F6K21_39340 [Symploca sp. SIO2D2]|nr:hypothetical protein [Symploca sp. SIO2D2]
MAGLKLPHIDAGGEINVCLLHGELRELRKLRDKRELIAIGYKAQEIPPKISFTR